MPTWSELLSKLQKEIRPPIHDNIRRHYLHELSKKTDRDIIVYATKWTQRPTNSIEISIENGDIQGLMEVMHGLERKKLDLIIHSPGGSAEAAEGILNYLRTKYDDIRAIIPMMAMSAATMLACGSNKIVMGKHSFLGPIDPQIRISTELGERYVPAQIIKDQWERAIDEIKEGDPRVAVAWLPIIKQYGPDLLQLCDVAIDLSRDLVKGWLENYMFSNLKEKSKADRIASWLSDQREFKSHGRLISRKQLVDHGLKIEPLEKDQELQDLVLSIFHSTTLTFDHTQAIKIIENHKGKAFIIMSKVVPIEKTLQ